MPSSRLRQRERAEFETQQAAQNQTITVRVLVVKIKQEDQEEQIWTNTAQQPENLLSDEEEDLGISPSKPTKFTSTKPKNEVHQRTRSSANKRAHQSALEQYPKPDSTTAEMASDDEIEAFAVGDDLGPAAKKTKLDDETPTSTAVPPPHSDTASELLNKKLRLRSRIESLEKDIAKTKADITGLKHIKAIAKGLLESFENRMLVPTGITDLEADRQLLSIL